MTRLSLGLEQLVASPPAYLEGQRIGLLCNAASVDSHLKHARHLLYERFGDQLTCLFSPQHGLFAEKQDNMIESDHRYDPSLNIPVISLYSETRMPTKQMFEAIDALLIDLQDVGTRVYTFIYTMSYCMEAARLYGKKVVVLDRPNPIGGEAVEGNVLDGFWRSFVGRYPIPMRHGLTIGELARLFNTAFNINCDLEVIPLTGWRRDIYFQHTDLPWVAPSPNMPTPVTAMVYPGQVIWEGTNVSEARGTTQPFEIFGAPYIDTKRILGKLNMDLLPGIVLRPLEFEPTANKWQGQRCHGFQIHVTDPGRYRPYRTSLALLQAILKCHKDSFEYKSPPYEYEYERAPIDLIIGDQDIRGQLEDMVPIDVIEAGWQNGLDEYDQMRKQFYLY